MFSNPNPTTKQHAIVNIQLNIFRFSHLKYSRMSCPCVIFCDFYRYLVLSNTLAETSHVGDSSPRCMNVTFKNSRFNI